MINAYSLKTLASTIDDSGVGDASSTNEFGMSPVRTPEI